jgi:lipoprotein-anchoring transpeptidase ErfK/SrfK
VRPETGPKKELPPQFRRTLVDYYTKEPAGTLIIDAPNTYLYLVLGNGKALRPTRRARARSSSRPS